MNPVRRLLAAVVLLALATVTARAAETQVVEMRLKYGDDPRWAAPDFDDHAWSKVPLTEMPGHAGPYWVRLRVGPHYVDPRPIDREVRVRLSWPADGKVDGLFLVSVFSYDLYWDGRLLDRSGRVGASRAEEVPGLLKHLIRIPDELVGGREHVLALRISSHHYNFPGAKVFSMTASPVDLVSFITYYERVPILPLMLMAGALVIAAMSVLMFLFTDRRRSLLLCTILSLFLAAFYGLIAMGYVHNATYVWLAPRYITIGVIAACIAVLLPWLLAEHFRVLRRGEWLLALVPLLVAAWLSGGRYEIRALWMCRGMLLVSAGIIAVAAWRGRPAARWLIVLPLIGIPLVRTWAALFLDPSFFIFLEALVLFVFASLGLQVRAERHRARELKLTAARLETELLKRNIQPHFLLNTLATIIEMIEQTPKSAVALIESLANEFRILARVSGEKLIPLAQELELCRAHLGIMTLRKGARCSLTVHGVDETWRVPPALFHTLVENGLKHRMPRNGEQRFELRGERAAGVTRYVMLSHGVAAGRGAALEDGTGTRYIKARLEESFPGRWRFTASTVAEGWQTVIEIDDDKPAERGLRAFLLPAHEAREGIV